MRCEYCDTEYEDQSLKRITIRTVRPGESVIRAEVALDKWGIAHNPEGARDYALRELRTQIADGLLGYMKLTTAENHSFMGETEIIRGEVRVIDPMFDDRY
jgi:hypothetical protein